MMGGNGEIPIEAIMQMLQMMKRDGAALQRKKKPESFSVTMESSEMSEDNDGKMGDPMFSEDYMDLASGDSSLDPDEEEDDDMAEVGGY